MVFANFSHSTYQYPIFFLGMQEEAQWYRGEVLVSRNQTAFADTLLWLFTISFIWIKELHFSELSFLLHKGEQ